MKKLKLFIDRALLCLNFRKFMDATFDIKKSNLTYLSAVFFCAIPMVSEAQILTETTVPIQVGQKLGTDFWNRNHEIFDNGKLIVSNLSGDKGKFIIIDFWASWCTTCIKKIPLLDSFQKANSKLFKVVLVNPKRSRDSLTNITRIFSNIRTEVPDINATSIINDVYLANAFPYHYIPHYIWINAQGVVVAITGYDLLTIANLDAVLGRAQRYIAKHPSTPKKP
ncbi:TlpA disulfide reductase family protein [Pedobacter sp. BMA]|uniref:TlpA family protein disulfide reductase n=1 Tax=Pedobacter sp. BMA TaxID=1663685 RepID=UPI00064B5DB9|nr:TlpA disulfide reductase family protein [Pedobacter sp. BMA]KLT64040.1 hypothetical protein AB669_18420 [Pedobacter sp. BMA]